MTVYKYNRYINRRKVTEINAGQRPYGEISGKYRNIWRMFQDIILKSVSSITYELTDQNNNVVVVTDEVTSLFSKKKVEVKFYNKSVWNTILVAETKYVDLGDEITFTYENKKYLIKKKPLKPAILYLNDIEIGEWKIRVKDRQVVFNLDNNYLDKEYLFLGIFHSYYYDKN